MKMGPMLSNLLRVAQRQLPRISEEGEEERAQTKSVLGFALRKVSFVVYCLALAGIIAWVALQVAAPNGSTGKTVQVQLARGPFTVLDFAPTAKKEPRAIIVFGSGDGGWTPFEEAICKMLQLRGYEAIGIDFTSYADSDYTLEILQGDMDRIAHAFRARYADNNPPVILGGYSMGAAQAIAAAGGPHPPAGLIGLLLVDPRSRGRYGLRLADRGEALPTGPGTFSMDEFTKSMNGVRVVQWHATEDSIDSRTWLELLTAPHKEFDFEQAGHLYVHGRADFLTQLGDSVNWIFRPSSTVITAAPNR